MSKYLALSDEELFQLLKADDESAYTELYERYKKPLLVYTLKKVSADEAEDLVHDFFIRLWANRHSLNISDSVKGYMFRALRNRVIDFFARSATVQKYLDSIEDFSITQFSENADYKLREKLFLEKIDSLLLKHGPKAQSIIRLRMQGYTNPEVAEMLNISEKTVRNQYSLLSKYLGEKLRVLVFIHFF